MTRVISLKHSADWGVSYSVESSNQKMNCAGNVTEGSKESSSVSDEQGKTARYFIG